MSALQQFFGAFGRALTRTPVPPQPTPTIRYSSLFNIFQLENAALFDIDRDVPLTDDDIQCLIEIGRQNQSLFTHHLTQEDQTRITSRHHTARTDGAFMTFVEYTHTVIEEGDQDWASMIICTFEMNHGIPEIIPHFTLTGRYVLNHDGCRHLIPRQVCCRMIYKDEECLFSPVSAGELMASIAYAAQAQMQLFAGIPMSVSQNQKWLEASNLPAAEGEIGRLVNRASHHFQQEMTGLRNAPAPHEPPSHQPT